MLCLHVRLFSKCVPGFCGGIGFSGTGDTVTVSHCMGAGNQIQDLCKSSQCSLPLSNLSRPPFFFKVKCPLNGILSKGKRIPCLTVSGKEIFLVFCNQDHEETALPSAA